MTQAADPGEARSGETRRQMVSSTDIKPRGQQGKGPTKGRKKARGPLVAGLSVGVVVVIVAAFIVFKVTSSPAKSPGEQPAQADVVAAVTGVPASELNAIGTSAISSSSYPVKVSGLPALTSGGLPEVFYYGAEWCPFCAAERWAMVNALSRFGTFSHLGFVQSASDDVYPSTNTFSFYGSTYSSKYLSFVPIEREDTNRNPLQPITKAQLALLAHLDVPPVVPDSAPKKYSFPFIDLGNQYVVGGAQYDPGVLSGLSWQTIAGSLSLPSSTPAKDILGAANVLTAGICLITHNQPADVCSMAPVKAAESKVAGLKPIAAVGT